MKALVIDLGRRSVRYGLVTDDNRLSDVSRVDVGDAGFLSLIKSIVADRGLDISAMTLAVAAPGPFLGELYEPLDLPGWGFRISDLKREFTDRLIVVHDVIAGALGVAVQAKVKRISGPIAANESNGLPPSPKAFIQTGIGLGMAALLPTPAGDWLPISGEGGSATIAPLSEDEDIVFRHFRTAPGRWGFPSAQALLSTESLASVARALRPTFPEIDATEVIAKASEGDEIARRALNVYAGFLGTFAGDVALMFRSYKGVYIAGYLPNDLDEVARNIFLSRFRQRGPAGRQLEPIPIFTIGDEFHTLAGLASLTAEVEKV